MKNPPEIKFGLSGHFRLLKFREGEEPRVVADFDNLIVNGGLDRIAVGTVAGSVQVGTGSAAESATDTALQSYLAGSNSNGGFSDTYSSNEAVSPYWASQTKTRQFTPGQATGNITEVAAAWTTATGNIFSRALIRDGGGTPVSITVLADEYLVVQYTLRVYCPMDDVVSTINVDGVNRTVTLRAANAMSSTWDAPLDSAFNNLSLGTFGVYDGAIGLITGGPSGTNTSVGEAVSTYVNGNYYLDFTLTASLSQGNYAGGIGALRFTTAAGDYQVGLVPKVVKTSDDVFTAVLRVSWARYVP
jgi:hypothetical protein